MIVNVSLEQARLLAQAEQQVTQALVHRNFVLDVMTIGHVPLGSTLLDINTETGVLTFKEPEAADG